MLQSLTIYNYALISELHIDFKAGMSVLTGETGAGKSIIMGALSLVQGQRADTRVIREGEQKAVVEAVFDLKNYNLNSFFAENELDYSDSCIIRREVTSNSKSRAFINDTPVSLNQLRDLSNRLIDIHSQHENLLLSTENYQLQLVDAVAENSTELTDYQTAFQVWNQAKSELNKLKKEAERQAADLDYLQFQLTQLEEAKLQEGEQAELESEQEMLSHVEEIKTELQSADYLLTNDETNVLRALKDISSSIQKIKSYLTQGESWVERLETVLIELKDISYDISSVQSELEFNPERLEFVDNRLSLLYSLQKKFKVETVEELIEIRNSYQMQLNRIDNFDEVLREAEKQLAQAEKQLQEKAKTLSETRKKASPIIENYLVEQLHLLGMPNVKFVVHFKDITDFTERGTDVVEFLFSANKNHSVQPVAEIASGGEISRLMLAIKSLLIKKSDLPSIVFDEIDTGVSGEIAGRMAEIMLKMSENTQVIAITHLPQIAAKASSHFLVYKDNSGKSTETFIRPLSPEERVQELAAMLSGKTVTEAALMNARELLK
ncbi:MAG TPA: DNA repair protein RecN [Bacteroidales bacterium]|nr:DNA repair protein RecN [Bacteroidales bacterium]